MTDHLDALDSNPADQVQRARNNQDQRYHDWPEPADDWTMAQLDAAKVVIERRMLEIDQAAAVIRERRHGRVLLDQRRVRGRDARRHVDGRAAEQGGGKPAGVVEPVQMKLEPYEELGVDRDANAPEIKSAFKRRAKKTHPDKGGSVDAFQRTRLALTVLMDPGRRAKYDATGEVEDAAPDNVRAAALQVIQAHMAMIVNQFMSAPDGTPGDDPRKIDVPGVIVKLIEVEVGQMREAIKAQEKAAAFLRDMRRRFRKKRNPADDPIGRAFDDQIARAGAEAEKLRDGIKMREKAVEIVRGYAFERDAAPLTMTMPGFGTFATTGRSW